MIELLYKIQTGHPGGSLSATEILTVLYQEKMRITSPEDPERDRLILSKGHAAPMLYLNLAERGFFPKESLETLRQCGSKLQGHPCAHKTRGVDASSGPLGLGLSVGCGMALAARLSGRNNMVYVILGDGELQEGGIWEASMSAAKFRTDRLIAILDHNHVQLDGSNDEIMPLGNVSEKFRTFGWNVLECDGHNIHDLSETIDQAIENRGSPSVIIAETVKGKGVSFMEGKNTWHGAAIGPHDYEQAILELGGVDNDEKNCDS